MYKRQGTKKKRKESGSNCECACSLDRLPIGLGVFISALVTNGSVRTAWTGSAGRKSRNRASRELRSTS